jgi:hypothetical protein
MITTDPFKFFHRWPPFLVHALARKRSGGKMPVALTPQEIIKSSGISDRSVKRVSAKLTWDGVKFSVIEAFFKGCNFGNEADQLRYMKEHACSKKGRFSHLSTVRWNIYLKKCAEVERLKEKP